jgi:hypothetical protein
LGADRRRESEVIVAGRSVTKRTATEPGSSAAGRTRGALKRPPVAGKTVRRSERRRVADQRLVLALELQALRIAAEDSVESYLRRVQAKLNDLVGRLESEAGSDARAAQRRDKAVASALERVRALRLKPSKGRSKDLSHIAELLNELDGLLPTAN